MASDQPTPCQHGRRFCMECHYDPKAPRATLPQMYDELLQDFDAMRKRAEKAEQRADELAAMVRATLAQQAKP